MWRWIYFSASVTKNKKKYDTENSRRRVLFFIQFFWFSLLPFSDGETSWNIFVLFGWIEGEKREGWTIKDDSLVVCECIYIFHCYVQLLKAQGSQQHQPKNNKNVMNVEKITYIIHQYFQHLPIFLFGLQNIHVYKTETKMRP